ncbi:hypothetical protein C8R44DRAFT_788178 [Mycena epipterygia]|nr:hypothetical protein C8R44DRAFT_788178 [Mycena epipterygia]
MQKTSGSPLNQARKRPRLDSSDADASTFVGADASGVAKIVRDSVYYKTSGDCKIRIGDTLFCIHRFQLERDSSAFQTMFQLPQGTEKPQGTTDEDPIILTGDTVEEFRALCWALYALPDEIVREGTAGKSMEKLVNVATISHKYQLAAFQSWSMAPIRRQCVTEGTSPYLKNCPSHLLPSLLRLSILYGDANLTTRVIDAWVFRLSTKARNQVFRSDPSFIPLPLSAFSDALKCAEEYSLRHFLGRLYYTRLNVAHRDSSSNNNPTFATMEFPFGDLNPLHLQPLLRGSWSLSTYWQHLLGAIPHLPGGGCLAHYKKCSLEWKKAWKEAATQGGATDILCKLNHIHSYMLLLQEYPTIMPAACAIKGGAIVASLVTKLEAALPDYFLGPP